MAAKTRLASTRKRKQRHEPGALDRCLRLPLATGTITAALTRKNLAAMRQKLLQRFNIFVINILRTLPAETTLRLLTNTSAESSLSLDLLALFPLSDISHILPATQKRYYKINHTLLINTLNTYPARRVALTPPKPP